MACSLKISEGVSASMEDQSQSMVPSKVVHFRGLPKRCSDEELLNLCTPFGEVVNFVCGVGTNKNQGLVEFADINQAISLVSNYTSSPPNHGRIRGRTIYIQYSERTEIVTKNFDSGNTLLVTFEGVKIKDVSIDVIHVVFSTYGFVQKISTFEKVAGFQALVQYADNETAASAKDELDGKSIPKYLLPEHVSGCDLHISYSGHQDLNIKFQSKRTRDYTKPMNKPSTDRASQPVMPPPTENHVLWASFENMQYDVTLDALYEVFSNYGTVKKISIFEKKGRTHALIQYPDVATATAAKNVLDGHCMYEGGYCKLRLSYSRHTNIFVKDFSDKSRDYTKQGHNVSVAQASATTWQNSPHVDGHALQAQMHGGQIPSWDPIQSYMYAPGTFPNQAYAVPPYPAYALGLRNPMIHNENYMETTPPGVPIYSPHLQVGFAGYLPHGMQPYYYGYY